MSTYSKILYQFVFSTKKRKKLLTKPKRETLYKYIGGILRNKQCKLYAINGVEDHLHILTHVHPTISISRLMQDVKQSSSIFIKKKSLFKGFTNWAKGYGAFTYSYSDRDNLIRYIKGQEAHHKSLTFEEEFVALLEEHEVDYDPRYLFRD